MPTITTLKAAKCKTTCCNRRWSPFAYPLYEQLHQIRARRKSIITICFIGSAVAIITGTSVSRTDDGGITAKSPPLCRNRLPRRLPWR
ncbi:LrgB family protein [Shigella flexneri]